MGIRFEEILYAFLIVEEVQHGHGIDIIISFIVSCPWREVTITEEVRAVDLRKCKCRKKDSLERAECLPDYDGERIAPDAAEVRVEQW